MSPATNSLELKDETYLCRRIDSGSFYLSKYFKRQQKRKSVDITGSRALIGIAAVDGGTLRFRQSGGFTSHFGNRIGLFIPPFSIYETISDFESCQLSFMVTDNPLIINASDSPELFRTELESFSGESAGIRTLLSEISSNGTEVFGRTPEGAVKAVKECLDSEYQEIIDIKSLAARFGIKDYELSRRFRQNLGISPLAYLNNLRSIEAVYALIDRGKRLKIIDLAFEVGFRDLSRFNKQFKKNLKFIPRRLFFGPET